MSEYLTGAIIAILVYSLILTIFAVYKDSSSYYVPSELDFIEAGPVCWLLVLIVKALGRFLKKTGISAKISEKREERSQKEKSEKYIQKLSKRVVKVYASGRFLDDMIDFDVRTKCTRDDYEGWGALEIKKPQHERLNNRFERMMYGKQKEEMIHELAKYFNLITVDMLREMDFKEWAITAYDYEFKNGLKLYIIKSPEELAALGIRQKRKK